MVKVSTSVVYVLFLSVFGIKAASANLVNKHLLVESRLFQQQDTIKKVSKSDTIGEMMKTLVRFNKLRDTLDIVRSKNVPNLSLQQMVKGNLAGVYVQETSGEPGSEQSMIVQGPSGLMFAKKDMYSLQPAVYLNGVPLAQDHPFAYDVQKYDYTRIGPANNLLSQINIDNVSSIVVIKDPFELAKLGPNAANGAIYITTKNAKSGSREISLNSYYGYALQPGVSPTNGAFENNFRKPFYQKYATTANYNTYASYLRDSTNLDYFGKSNWDDRYYQTSPSYTVNLGITGGSERANFRFYGSATQDAGNADKTGLSRYNLSFGLNMAPFKWLTVSSSINAIRLDRDRNRSLRDRFAETQYIPDTSNPLSPNIDNYSSYLAIVDGATDLNRTTGINGNFILSAKFKRLTLTTSLLGDYTEGIRDVFLPSTLLAGISYVSNYFGYNQRLILDNRASYEFDLGSKSHKLKADLGQSFQSDTYKYNYTRGYNGPNDFIKIIQVNGNANSGFDYLNAYGDFYVFRFLDKQRSRLFSLYASGSYKYKNLISVDAILRRDGSSNGQPDSRWLFAPSFSASWSLKHQFLGSSDFINALDLSAGWGRTMRPFMDDRFAAGPQYTTVNGWTDEPTLPGYGSFIGVARPYTSGYVGYNIPLPVSDRTNITLSSSMLKGRLTAAVTVYNRDDRRQVINLPVAQELGYTTEYKSGLDINNRGVEFLVTAAPVQSKAGLGWQTGLNLSYNQNRVNALPNGLQELIYQNNKLQVGASAGSYWLYTNQGIYASDAEIPVNPQTGQKMTFNGIALKAGDPRWADVNQDFRIDQNDKTIVGDRLPKVIGGWSNTLSYKRFDLNFNIFFALGQKAINQYDAARYDFINRESANNITSVREITAWQSFDAARQYPIYNPFSSVVPYREDQDLFLENASYAKLRSVTLGYDFTGMLKNKAKIKRAYLYVSGTNLLTVTSFSGVDPELVNYNGMYDGANITIPKTFVLGFKLDL